MANLFDQYKQMPQTNTGQALSMVMQSNRDLNSSISRIGDTFKNRSDEMSKAEELAKQEARYKTQEARRASNHKYLTNKRDKEDKAEEALIDLDKNLTPSANRSISGVEDYIGGLSEADFNKKVGRVDGTPEEQKQHKLFTKELLKTYDSVGTQSKADAYNEMFNAARSKGVSVANADAFAQRKTAGMMSNAEKVAALQKRYDRDYEDAIKTDEFNLKLGKALKDKSTNYKDKTLTGGTPSSYSERAAIQSINTFLSTGDDKLKSDEVIAFNKAATAIVENPNLNYTWSDIDAVKSSAKDSGLWLVGHPNMNMETLKSSLATLPKSDSKHKHKKSYLELLSKTKPPVRKYASDSPQQTSAEVLADFKRRLEGGTSEPSTVPPKIIDTKKVNDKTGKIDITKDIKIGEDTHTPLIMPGSAEHKALLEKIKKAHFNGEGSAEGDKEIVSGFGVPNGFDKKEFNTTKPFHEQVGITTPKKRKEFARWFYTMDPPTQKQYLLSLPKELREQAIETANPDVYRGGLFRNIGGILEGSISDLGTGVKALYEGSASASGATVGYLWDSLSSNKYDSNTDKRGMGQRFADKLNESNGYNDTKKNYRAKIAKLKAITDLRESVTEEEPSENWEILKNNLSKGVDRQVDALSTAPIESRKNIQQQLVANNIMKGNMSFEKKVQAMQNAGINPTDPVILGNMSDGDRLGIQAILDAEQATQALMQQNPGMSYEVAKTYINSLAGVTNYPQFFK